MPMSAADLIAAVEGGRESELLQLLGAGAGVNSRDGAGDTALSYAMGHDLAGMVSALLARPDTRLDTANTAGQTPLHWASYNDCDNVIALFCRDSRATPALLNAKNLRGDTALMVAVYWGRLNCLVALAGQSGLDWGTRDSSGFSLEEVARQRKHHHILAFLQQRPLLQLKKRNEALEVEVKKLRETARADKEKFENTIGALQNQLRAKTEMSTVTQITDGHFQMEEEVRML